MLNDNVSYTISIKKGAIHCQYCIPAVVFLYTALYSPNQRPVKNSTATEQNIVMEFESNKFKKILLNYFVCLTSCCLKLFVIDLEEQPA